MDVTIDKFGRIVIPKPVRDALGLSAGTKLRLETMESENGDQEIALRPEREQPPFVRKGRGNVLVYTGELVDPDLDIGDFIKEQREKRTRHIAGLE